MRVRIMMKIRQHVGDICQSHRSFCQRSLEAVGKVSPLFRQAENCLLSDYRPYKRAQARHALEGATDNHYVGLNGFTAAMAYARLAYEI